MPNFATALKEEIRRLARKEVRTHTGSTRRAGSQHRRMLAELKRQVRKLQRTVEFLESQERERVAQPLVPQGLAENARYSPKWLVSHRKRLGLSAEDYGRLAGVSAQSIYQWERGKVKPRKGQQAMLAALRVLKKRQAAQRLEVLGGAQKNGGKK